MKRKSNAVRADSSNASPSGTTRWLVCMLGEMDPSYFADEIPERDIQMAGTAWSEMAAERGLTDATDVAHSHSNWKLVAAVSGFTAACSAAMTGILVFVCMRHFHSFDGV